MLKKDLISLVVYFFDRINPACSGRLILSCKSKDISYFLREFTIHNFLYELSRCRLDEPEALKEFGQLEPVLFEGTNIIVTAGFVKGYTGQKILFILRPLKNAQFCSSSRKAKILNVGIH